MLPNAFSNLWRPKIFTNGTISMLNMLYIWFGKWVRDRPLSTNGQERAMLLQIHRLVILCISPRWLIPLLNFLGLGVRRHLWVRTGTDYSCRVLEYKDKSRLDTCSSKTDVCGATCKDMGWFSEWQLIPLKFGFGLSPIFFTNNCTILNCYIPTLISTNFMLNIYNG